MKAETEKKTRNGRIIPSRMYTVKFTALHLHISPPTLRKMARNGGIRTVPCGGTFRVPGAEILRVTAPMKAGGEH